MTVEIEYRCNIAPDMMSPIQTRMAKQIEENRGFPITDLERELNGEIYIIRVKSGTLPSAAIDNMLKDIEEYLHPSSEHIETREV